MPNIGPAELLILGIFLLVAFVIIIAIVVAIVILVGRSGKAQMSQIHQHPQQNAPAN